MDIHVGLSAFDTALSRRGIDALHAGIETVASTRGMLVRITSATDVNCPCVAANHVRVAGCTSRRLSPFGRKGHLYHLDPFADLADHNWTEQQIVLCQPRDVQDPCGDVRGYLSGISPYSDKEFLKAPEKL